MWKCSTNVRKAWYFKFTEVLCLVPLYLAYCLTGWDLSAQVSKPYLTDSHTPF